MMNKKINNLTKIFLKDYTEKINIIKDNKIDKKSSMVWMIIVLLFCLTYISVYIISNLNNAGTPELALKVYLPLVALIMMFQLTVIVCNMFYYSKDIEYILPLPIKPIEILMSKFNTVVAIMYITEAIFLVIPLLMYGLLVAGTIRFFIYSILILAIFPIFYTLIVGILTLILMKIFKKIKNENIIQIIIISILMFCLMGGTYIILSKNIEDLQNAENQQIINERLDEINKYFVITEPITKLLTEKNIIKNIINIIKIIFIEGILLIIFNLLGNKIYYYNLLNKYKKNTTKKKKEYKYKKNNKEKIYLKNEFRKIFRNTNYFSQTIYNYISTVVIALFLISAIIPMFIQSIQADNNINIEQLKFQLMCMVIMATQIVATFNNLAITAISKEGKEAPFMKYIPIKLNRQFKLKAMPQIIINIIMIISILLVIYTKVDTIPCSYYIIAFITATMINIIFTYLLLLIDCKKPNLNWTNQESIVKSSKKIYKYFITIIIILILLYFIEILEQIKFIYAIGIINIFFIIILIILNNYINKNSNKIFNKIN